MCFNSYPELIYLNSHPLEVVSRHSDPQLQVAENYSHVFNLSTNICKSWCLDTYLQWLGRLIKQIKNDNNRDQQDRGNKHSAPHRNQVPRDIFE